MTAPRTSPRITRRPLVKALRGVSFAAAPGEAVALMGPSGCGKTTLLSILSSLEPPSSGEVRIAGKPLDSYRPFAAFAPTGWASSSSSITCCRT
jgi:ABC-type multidrug transport system ATPase subunit